jgi:hypothetical protein
MGARFKIGTFDMNPRLSSFILGSFILLRTSKANSFVAPHQR